MSLWILLANLISSSVSTKIFRSMRSLNLFSYRAKIPSNMTRGWHLTWSNYPFTLECDTKSYIGRSTSLYYNSSLILIYARSQSNAYGLSKLYLSAFSCCSGDRPLQNESNEIRQHLWSNFLLMISQTLVLPLAVPPVTPMNRGLFLKSKLPCLQAVFSLSNLLTYGDASILI